MKRPTAQLLLYLSAITLSSIVVACLFAPILPYPFIKIARRAAMVIAALTLLPFATRIQHRRWHDIGLERSCRMWRGLLQGLGLGMTLFGALLFVLQAVGVVALYPPAGHAWWLLVGFLPVAALIGFFEELFFRGVILRSLMADLGMSAGVLLSSSLYALLHFVKFLAHPLQIIPELVGLFLFGCLLAYSYLRTKLLALPIGLHMSLAYLAKMGRRFVEFKGHDPQWLFGTDRWIDGAFAWASFCVLALFITLATRPQTEKS